MIDSLVADASVWLSIFLREKDSERWIRPLSDAPLWAPDLLPYELANGILKARKNKRVTIEKAGDELLLHLPVLDVSWLPKDQWWAEGLRIARQQDITIYDAAYLAVAKVAKASFCSLDEKQVKAAKQEAITLLSIDHHPK